MPPYHFSANVPLGPSLQRINHRYERALGISKTQDETAAAAADNHTYNCAKPDYSQFEYENVTKDVDSRLVNRVDWPQSVRKVSSYLVQGEAQLKPWRGEGNAGGSPLLFYEPETLAQAEEKIAAQLPPADDSVDTAKEGEDSVNTTSDPSNPSDSAAAAAKAKRASDLNTIDPDDGTHLPGVTGSEPLGPIRGKMRTTPNIRKDKLTEISFDKEKNPSWSSWQRTLFNTKDALTYQYLVLKDQPPSFTNEYWDRRYLCTPSIAAHTGKMSLVSDSFSKNIGHDWYLSYERYRKAFIQKLRILPNVKLPKNNSNTGTGAVTAQSIDTLKDLASKTGNIEYPISPFRDQCTNGSSTLLANFV